MQETAHIFAGNYKNGTVLHKTVANDELLIEEELDEMLTETGYLDSVWASYNGQHPIDECCEDFDRYLAYVREKKKIA